MRFSSKRETLSIVFKRAVVGMTVPLLLFLSLGNAAQAANIVPSAPKNASVQGLSGQGKASGLSVSPLRQSLTLKPGQADKIDVTLKNITGGPIIAQSHVIDFTSDNSTGNPKLITNTNQTSPSSIKPFVIGLGNVPLATGQSVSYAIPVQAPNNATPGAYYGIIEYQAVPYNSSQTKGNSVVALTAAVSQLVFITVPGVTNDHMALTNIDIYSDKSGTDSGVFFTHPPKQAGIELQNIGNAFQTPFGNVTIKGTTGSKVYSYELNGGITRGIVLPNSTRIFKNDIKNVSTPGRYTINISASYGNGSAILLGSKSFWYIPLWAMIVIAAIILILIGVVWLVVRRIRGSSNRRRQ